MRKVAICLVVMVGLLGGPALAPALAQEPIKAILNHNFNDDHTCALAAKLFAELAKEKTGGQLLVEIRGGGQLYDRRQEMMALSEGAVQLVAQNAPGFFNIARGFMVTFMPLMWKDWDTLRQLYATDEWKEMLVDLEKKNNTVLLCQNGAGPGVVFNRVRPIVKPDDFKGLKMRAVSPVEKVLFQAGGAVIVTVPVSELFTSVQTGMVDGGSTTGDRYIFEGYTEVAKFSSDPVKQPLLLTDGWIAANADWWKRLPEGMRQILAKDVLPQVESYNRKLLSELDQRFVATVQKAGVTVTNWDAAAMRVAAKKGWESLKSPIGEKLFNRALAVAGVTN